MINLLFKKPIFIFTIKPIFLYNQIVAFEDKDWRIKNDESN